MRHNLLLNRSRGTASLQPLVLLAIIVVMTGAQAVLVPGSLTVEQMLIISRQASALGIITLGQAAVILVGGIDLSVGATVMMVNIFCISAMQGSDANGPLGLLVCLFIGLAIGTANAFGVLFLKIAPFVMTLCTTTICEGICYVYTQGSPTGSAAPFIRALGTGRLFGIPFSTLIWLALAAAMWVVLRFTALGRRLYAVGGQPQGCPTQRHRQCPGSGRGLYLLRSHVRCGRPDPDRVPQHCFPDPGRGLLHELAGCGPDWRQRH